MKIIVNYKGVEFDVEFHYQPEEPEVRYYSDGSGYPGSPAYIELEEISHKETSFLELLEDDAEEIEKLILADLKDY